MSERVHTCSECKTQASWDKNWWWYGSLKDLDDYDRSPPILKFCSDKCRDKRLGEIEKLEKQLAAIQLPTVNFEDETSEGD